MRLNAKGQLGVGERCVEADGQGIKYAFCRLGTADGPWQYDEASIFFLMKTHYGGHRTEELKVSYGRY